MGCVNSKEEDKSPAGAGGTTAKYMPPNSVTTPTSQPVPQPSQHRISVASGVGSHNGSVGYGQPLPSVPSPLPEDGSLFVARYAYQARTSEDLSFEKGEELKVSVCA